MKHPKFHLRESIEDPNKIEYPPDEFMQKYHYNAKSLHFVRTLSNKLVRAQVYAQKRGWNVLIKIGKINGFDVYLWSCEYHQ